MPLSNFYFCFLLDHSLQFSFHFFAELCFLPPFHILLSHYCSLCFFIIWCSPSPSIVPIFTFHKPTVSYKLHFHLPIPYCWYTLQEHVLSAFLCVGRKELLRMLAPFIHTATWPLWSQTNCLGLLFMARGSTTFSLFYFDFLALHLSLLQLMGRSHSIVRNEAQLSSLRLHSERRAMGSLQRDLPIFITQE